jgi:alpha-tubulin suppressor-like RCC1 family protein
VVPSIDSVVSLGIGLASSAGSGHTCVVRRDGSAWCWGHNLQGQLGDGTTMYRTAAIRVAF